MFLVPLRLQTLGVFTDQEKVPKLYRLYRQCFEMSCLSAGCRENTRSNSFPELETSPPQTSRLFTGSTGRTNVLN